MWLDRTLLLRQEKLCIIVGLSVFCLRNVPRWKSNHRSAVDSDWRNSNHTMGTSMMVAYFLRRFSPSFKLAFAELDHVWIWGQLCHYTRVYGMNMSTIWYDKYLHNTWTIVIIFCQTHFVVNDLWRLDLNVTRFQPMHWLLVRWT